MILCNMTHNQLCYLLQQDLELLFQEELTALSASVFIEYLFLDGRDKRAASGLMLLLLLRGGSIPNKTRFDFFACPCTFSTALLGL